MRFCTGCGRPRDEGVRFCTACGNPFPDPGPPAAARPAGPLPPPPPAEPVHPGPADAPLFLDTRAQPPYGLDDLLNSGQRRDVLAGPAGDGRPSGRHLRLVLLAVIAVVLAGGGAAAAMVLGGHGSKHPSQAAGPRKPAVTPSAAASSSSPAVSPRPASSPGAGPVAVAASLAANPQAHRIVTLLDSYFGAINGHNYPDYAALLTPAEQQSQTATQFSSGFASTKDSGERLQALSPGPDGTTVATVTFTSRQSPADSINGHESCTSWRIQLYLQPTGNAYLIGEPPSSYHASYAACR